MTLASNPRPVSHGPYTPTQFTAIGQLVYKKFWKLTGAPTDRWTRPVALPQTWLIKMPSEYRSDSKYILNHSHHLLLVQKRCSDEENAGQNVVNKHQERTYEFCVGGLVSKFLSRTFQLHIFLIIGQNGQSCIGICSICATGRTQTITASFCVGEN